MGGKKYHLLLLCLRRTIERCRGGGKGQRIAGDTAGSWFVSLKKGGATVENDSFKKRQNTLQL